MAFRAAGSTAAVPQGSGRVDVLTHPYTTAACAAGIVTATTSRDSSALSLTREVKDAPASAGLRMQLN